MFKYILPTSAPLSNGYILSCNTVGALTWIPNSVLGVSSVTATSPIFSSGGVTPNITIQQASNTQHGFLSSTDWALFNSKQAPLTFSTGLSNNSGTITSNISTGVNGGQAIYGGILTTQGLTIRANIADLTGTISITTSTVSTNHSTGALIVAGGMGVGNSINCAGSIQAWGANGLIAGENKSSGIPNIPGTIKLWSAGDNSYYTNIITATQTANATYTLPVSMPPSNGFLMSDSNGIMSWGVGISPPNYSISFINTDWVGPSMGYYTILFTHNLHNFLLEVDVWDSSNQSVWVERLLTDDDHVTLKIPADPDMRFSGLIWVKII